MSARRRKYGLIGVGVALPATLAAGLAIAAGGAQPADKVVAAGDHTQVFSPNTNVTLLTATMKTSKPTDLMLQTTLECSILTDLTTNNQNPSANAHSGVRVWIEFDGKIVPIQSTSQPPQDGSNPDAGNDTDKVTFCDREYQRTVTDQENPTDGQDQEQDYIHTKSAHGFNWVRMNTGSGQHTIVVKADLTQSTSGPNANAQAIVGNRTLIVEPAKMANDAVIGTTGTN